MSRHVSALAPILALWLGAGPAAGQALDAATRAPPAAGDVIGFDDVARLKPYLPPQFWTHRDLFFFEGMRLVVGATRDYSPAAAYAAATRRFAGQTRLGPDGSLEGYTAGQPFPMDEIDCARDPHAGGKVIWNFDHQWEGDGRSTRFQYSYWDRGERLPIHYRGTSRLVWLSNRVEDQYLREGGGDIFENEDRKTVYGLEVKDPPDSRGVAILSYRYKKSEGPLARSRNDDTWVWSPSIRRVRRISTAQRTDAVAGTDFTLDDLRSFNGIIPQYQWRCLREARVIAPVGSTARGYPHGNDHDFGPTGLSFANDRWELRDAVVLEMQPKNPDHPYSRKLLYLDRQTLVPLYSFAYDRKGELWKITWHNSRWSEDDPDYYEGWESVAEPRDLKVVSDIIVNVQTGTGNRIELWDAHGTPLPGKGRIRSFIDVGRLTRRR